MGKYGTGLVLAITACLTGCGSSVDCSGPEVQAMVEKVLREQVYPDPSYSRDPRMRARYDELADAKYEISDIVTVRRPTDSKPSAVCKAKLDHSLYDVSKDDEKERRADAEANTARRQIQESATGSESPAELAERFAAVSRRREAFQADPGSLSRTDHRMVFTSTFTYTVSQTDDGRLYVEVEAEGR